MVPSLSLQSQLRWMVFWTLLFAPFLIWAQSQNPIDRLELIELLAQKNFPKLEETLTLLQKAYESDYRQEDAVKFAFETFATSAPRLAAPLDEWVDTYPASYAAHLSRGIYQMHRGEIARGFGYMSETHDNQLEEMNYFFERAYADILHAIRLNDRSTIAWNSLLRWAKHKVGLEEMRVLLDKALASNPKSLVIRRQYAFNLQPKWGGSLKQMRHFINESNLYLKVNPGLKILRGYFHYTLADIHKQANQYDQALAEIDKAVATGDHPLFIWSRGQYHYAQEHYREALSDFDMLLSIWPQRPEAHDKRARTYQKLKQPQQAFADWELALLLDPLNPSYLLNRAYLHQQQGDYVRAKRDMEQALKLGTNRHIIWAMKGALELSHLNQYADAAQSFEKAIELKPSHATYWYQRGVARYNQKECSVIHDLEIYVALCELSNECDEEAVNWSRQATKTLVAYCPA